jgi:hypothetical protein
MNREGENQKAQLIREVTERLAASGNVCDQRKGRDLEELLELSETIWRDRFSLEGFLSGARRMLLAVCTFTGVRSFIWEGKPGMAERFRFVIGMTPDYPLSLPAIKFQEPIPYSPHVVHPAFLPDDLAGLSGELQEYLRNGRGCMCYVHSQQWSPTTDSLAIACWEASRILAGRFHAEAGSLNQSARDFMLRGEAGDRMGPSLPYPRTPAEGRQREALFSWGQGDAAEAPDSDAMDWVDEGDREAERHAS